ncbi:MAG: helix-turn-helix transcriptional regulator [Pseudomonadota bacterium]
MNSIEISSGNVYDDLGHPDAAEMQIKARLAGRIAQIIKSARMTQASASEILGMPQPKLSGMLRGQFRGISETKMLDCLNRLGQDVEIVIRESSSAPRNGRTSVLFAE